MKVFNDIISVNKNARGCYIVDTIKGCSICRARPGGCYGDCYANKISSRYGFDFSNTIKMKFIDSMQDKLFDYSHNKHEEEVLSYISSIDMPFIRIGEMGDPSEDWQHTSSIIDVLSESGKAIVIITKHWHEIPELVLKSFSSKNIIINTSISALDNKTELEYRERQIHRISNYCKSVPRIVSCNFNTGNETGKMLGNIQDGLFSKYRAIDTIFRPSNKNKLILDGVINVSKMQFMGAKLLVSSHVDKPYLGYCNTCPDLCGVNH